LPLAVTAFRSAYPDVELAVRSARIAGLWSILENREIELSLMWDYEPVRQRVPRRYSLPYGSAA
jgi:hypothetical protein